MIRVLVVDDQQLLRRGLKLLLAQSPEIQVVTTCASGRRNPGQPAQQRG